MSAKDLYEGREQTEIKHFILREYLARFAHIVGTFAGSITYVDCFSGPWNVRSENLEDSSFSIALQELRKAHTTLQGKGRTLGLRCMFLEKNRNAHLQLARFAQQIQDVEVRTENDELKGSIDKILTFVREGHGTFPFFFIDPTGWTGFEMELIAPLLKHRPGEVLINFMTDYVRRFIDHPNTRTRQQLAKLFGKEDVKAQVEALRDPREREEALVRTYTEEVKRIGGFTYACAAVVMYPEVNRSYFHLVYATRNRKGVVVFKDVEKRAMEHQEETRAKAQQRTRVKKKGQPELFPSMETPSRPIDDLRSRSLRHAKRQAAELLREKKRASYDLLWDQAMATPLVWDSDVKDWIKEWQSQRMVKLEGLKPRQRVPKLEDNNFVVWQGSSA